MANDVSFKIFCNFSADKVKPLALSKSGKVGKSSRGNPNNLMYAFPDVMVMAFVFDTSISTLFLGSSLIISIIFLAGIVILPPSMISAGIFLEIPISISVLVRIRESLSTDSISTLERMDNVGF